MSFEEDATLSLIDTLESPAHTRMRLIALAGAILVTIIMWVGHLTHPEIFLFFLEQGGWAKLLLAVVGAPPFVIAFIVSSFVFRQPVETDATGPMSTYFYQERSSRRWKIFIVAGLTGALNFVLMLATSGI